MHKRMCTLCARTYVGVVCVFVRGFVYGHVRALDEPVCVLTYRIPVPQVI